ncbi:hypothetical protein [Nocardia sp. NPDC057440]|uniref:hypothetical protein n=1 Tax=Nocardia sp. NPDC057440 TaxID=3346134 RepID=UPI00366D2D6C
MAGVTNDSTFAAVLERVNAAIAKAEQSHAKFKQENQPSAEDLQEMHRLAAAGELGAEMQAAASLVSSGQETWQSLCSGKSANGHLLASHLDRMNAEHGDAVAASV